MLKFKYTTKIKSPYRRIGNTTWMKPYSIYRLEFPFLCPWVGQTSFCMVSSGNYRLRRIVEVMTEIGEIRHFIPLKDVCNLRVLMHPVQKDTKC